MNDLCLALVLVHCVWLLTMRPSRAWVIKAVGLVLAAAGLWYWRPDRAGIYVIGPWLLLILLPLWLQQWSMYLIRQRRLLWARWTAALLTLLHPTSSVRHMRQMISVLDEFYRGEVVAGTHLAQRLGIHDPGIQNLALVIDAQMTGHWAEFEHRLSQMPSQGTNDPSLLGGKILATAERGDWEELHRLCGVVSQVHCSPDQNAALAARTFAVLGDVSTMSNLLMGSGQLVAREGQEFWLAVAEQVSGAPDHAEWRLKKLLLRASPTLRPMVERRLALPAVGPPDGEVRDRSLAELSDLRSVILREARFAVLSGGRRVWPVMTLALIAVMIAVFLKEIPGGSEDTENLERLGAMVVPLTGEPGEWTHAFTSGFLHFGPLHLGLNMLGLLILGRLLERSWGPVRMLVQFLVCIVVSAALLPWLTFLEKDDIAVFAGASGGIMGLLGGLWGHLLVGRFCGATPLVRSQFRTASLLIVMQSVCDLMTPQVSMTCHLIGLCTGIIGGILMGLSGGRRGVRSSA